MFRGKVTWVLAVLHFIQTMDQSARAQFNYVGGIEQLFALSSQCNIKEIALAFSPLGDGTNENKLTNAGNIYSTS